VQAALAQIRYQSKPQILQVALAKMKNWIKSRLSSSKSRLKSRLKSLKFS